MVRLLVFCFCLPFTATAGDSPQFRGPDGEGHSAEQNLAITWSETENIRWKTEIEGLGWSTPTIQGSQVWLTTALEEGKSLRVLCLDKDSGKLVHNVEVFQPEEPGPIHTKNSYASPSVLIDGDFVYAHFGKLGTACLDRQANIVWKKTLTYDHRHGPGGSPIIVGNILIIACDGIDIQFVTGLDKRTGDEVWKTSRDGKMAYSTPLLIEIAGKPQVISSGGEWAIAYEPSTGHEIWRFQYPAGFSNVPRPVFGQGLVFVCSGYLKPCIYAVNPDGSGNVTETHMVWKLDRGAPLNPSPLIIGEEIYLMDDKGIATCLNAKTGKQHWQKRIGGNFSCSLLYADGRIYVSDENGKTYVFLPSKEEYREIAVNELPGRTLATIAAADESLFLRTDSALYRIQRADRTASLSP